MISLASEGTPLRILRHEKIHILKIPTQND